MPAAQPALAQVDVPYDPAASALAAPVQFTRYAGNPILSPNPANWWERLVTTNPAAWWDEERQKVRMLYRCAGDEPEHRIRFGLAESADGLHFDRLGNAPVFEPIPGTWEGGCVEDPRLIRIGGWHYLTYAVRMYPPGEYWLKGEQRRYRRPEVPPEFPHAARASCTVTGLAATRDFADWHRFGRITDPRFDDRDVVIFPERIAGKLWMLHRPMEWHGPGHGCAGPSMWITASDDLLHWGGPHQLLMAGRTPWEGDKIGVNCPPLRTEHGWFVLYHGKAADSHYRLGAALLDLDDPTRVLHRSDRWLMQPEGPYEIGGCYRGGVVFPCGMVLRGGTLFIYYGGGDRYVHVATAPWSDLLGWLRTCPA